MIGRSEQVITDGYLLRQVLGFGGVGQRAVGQVHDRLLVLLDQRLERLEIAPLHAEHQRYG